MTDIPPPPKRPSIAELSPRSKTLGVVALVAALGGGSGLSSLYQSMSSPDEALDKLRGTVATLRASVDELNRRLDKHDAEHARLSDKLDSDRRAVDRRIDSVQRGLASR